MSGEHASLSPEFLASVQPIVLVGGKSRRFGRDKLREPWGEPGMVLVQRPIETLRTIFGRRVKLVGECDPGIVALADGVILDEHPGVGPMGGIVSTLRAWGGPVFVLAGDMPGVRPSDVLSLLSTATRGQSSWAVLAKTDRLHPCAGLYWPASLKPLAHALASENRSLVGALPESHLVTCPLPNSTVGNINSPGDLIQPF